MTKIAEKLQQEAWESVATHDQLRERFAKRVPSVRRRFRVEDTPAGNSLLTKQRAQDTRARFGGKVVEVIPFVSLPERQAANLGKCPRCEAPGGKPCKSSAGHAVVPHMARWELD